MGAEYKLDLTSDVTHLIVGDTDTPKYKYVAREREDVSVLLPEWVDAVRKQWMADEDIDLNALNKEYRVPTMAGLKICITGFDDLDFRAQLQNNVIENGGQYSGDLTKEVTHLIAKIPEGKKYDYGTQWQKKVVSLRWYKDTLERGMQLDESSYHPSIPDDKQGLSAWNRATRKPTPPTRKRPTDDSQNFEQPRKMRRTASARFSSQNDTMWSDIVGNEDKDITNNSTKRLQVARSVPDLRDPENEKQKTEDRKVVIPKEEGIFEGKEFALQGFSVEQEPILRSVLLSNGGKLFQTLTDLGITAPEGERRKLLLVPHQTSLEQISWYDGSDDKIDVASELWVEHCMSTKTYLPPSAYPLGRLLPRTKPSGFSKLTVTSTGFSGIVPNHIDKIIRQLGGKYEQVFKCDANVLICNSRGHGNQQKVELARQWRIPSVSEAWLWACLRKNYAVSLDKYALPGPRVSRPPQQHTTEVKGRISGAAVPGKDPQVSVAKSQDKKPLKSSLSSQRAERTDLPSKPDGATCPSRQNNSLAVEHKEGSAYTKTEASSPSKPKPTEVRPAPPVLRSISPNSSPQHRQNTTQKPKKRLFQTFHGASNDIENSGANEPPLLAEEQIATNARADTKSLNGEIRELLDLKSKLKEIKSGDAAAGGNPKNKLIGRAISNLSNASATSQVLQSRASSIDSINTDGIGQEIGPITSMEAKGSGKEEASGNISFIGRATSKMLDSRPVSVTMLEASAADDEVLQWSEQPQEPALTQLVYEDPEETIQTREKLAAKRRQRSKLGQKESDPKPPKQRAPTKRIQDDEVLTNAGWGAGRRTRNHNKVSPPGLKGF